ncbi:hypothetical protein DSUL_140109 [Desulfovibrionales bacterium]
MAIPLDSLFISAVLDKPVISISDHRLGQVIDLTMIPTEPLPSISFVLVKRGRSTTAVPWRQINLFTALFVQINNANPETFDRSWQNEILIGRDILDKQIVDVEGTKVARVNDLRLERYRDQLYIVSVDVSVTGLARRLGQKRFWTAIVRLCGRTLPHHEISWQYVQPMNTNLSQLTLTLARDRLKDIHSLDINAQAVLQSLSLKNRV